MNNGIGRILCDILVSMMQRSKDENFHRLPHARGLTRNRGGWPHHGWREGHRGRRQQAKDGELHLDEVRVDIIQSRIGVPN